MTAVTIAPAAMAQLEDIYDYTFHRWGVKQADTYWDSLLEAIDRIAAKRVPWRAVQADIGVDGYFYRCGAHFIYWRTSGAAVRVVAILHQQMHQLDRVRDAFSGEP